MKCECGCGQDVNPARPVNRFVLGHANRRHPAGWDVVDRGHSTECWIWRGERSPDRYPRLGGKLAHRTMWERENGPIPDGLGLDHLCRQTLCVRPEHCEPVSNAENVRRGRSAKIDYEIAEEIRSATGSLRQIGREFGLHHSTVLAIRKGHSDRRQAW